MSGRGEQTGSSGPQGFPPVHTWGGGSFTWWGQRGLAAGLGLAELVRDLFVDGGQRDRVAPLQQRPRGQRTAAPTLCWEGMGVR